MISYGIPCTWPGLSPVSPPTGGAVPGDFYHDSKTPSTKRPREKGNEKKKKIKRFYLRSVFVVLYSFLFFFVFYIVLFLSVLFLKKIIGVIYLNFFNVS